MALLGYTIPMAVFKVNTINRVVLDWNLTANRQQIIIGLFSSSAIIGVIAKTAFQLRTQRRVWLEDALLICACLCLIAGTGLLYTFAETLYDPDSCGLFPDPETKPDELASHIKSSQQYQLTFLTLTWIVIFCVKFSFLFLFRPLVNRMRGMLLFWRFVVVLTSISFFICVGEPFFSCPKFGTGIRKPLIPLDSVGVQTNTSLTKLSAKPPSDWHYWNGLMFFL